MRTGAGTSVSTSIELRRLDRASAAAMAVQTITENGAYTATTVGEGVYQFSRVYRPRWATVSGWMLTIGLLGAGYWLLLIKRTEACTMWVTEDRASVRVILSGGLLPDVMTRVRGAFDEVEHTAGPSSDVNDVERGALEASDALRAVRVFRASAGATAAEADVVAADDIEPDLAFDLSAFGRGATDHHEPALRPAPAPAPAPVFDLPEVHFETGEHVRVMGVIYVGRNPMQSDANGKTVERLAIADATGTVAKTHFAMGANLSGLWVEDLFSANGTSVGVDAASARIVRPLERVAVAPGEKIFFGDLSADVIVNDDREASGLPMMPSSRV